MTPLWLLFEINRAIIGSQFSNFPTLIFCNESHPVRHHRMWRGVGKRFFTHFITLAVVETHWHRAEANKPQTGPIERKVKLFLFSVGLRERTKEASLIKSHLLINFPIKIHASTIKMWIHMRLGSSCLLMSRRPSSAQPRERAREIRNTLTIETTIPSNAFKRTELCGRTEKWKIAFSHPNAMIAQYSTTQQWTGGSRAVFLRKLWWRKLNF